MNTKQAHRRHDISDETWGRIKDFLPGTEGSVGRPAQDNRAFINAVLWVLRTGSPWRDLPPDCGNWNNVHRRFCRWRDRKVWEKLLESVIEDPDFEWLMMDASHVKVHSDASGAVGGNQDMDHTKGGSIPRYIWPWMRLAIQSESLLHQVPSMILSRLSRS
jgi:transposase